MADALLDLLRHNGHLQQQSHAVILYLREDTLTDNFLDNQRDGDDERRLYVGKGLGDDSWRRQACKEEQMATVTESEEELYGHTVHVSHGKNTQQVVARAHLLAQTVNDELNVAPQRTIREHDTLREPCRSTGIIDERHLISAILIIVDMLLAECHRILAAEHHI